MSSILLVTIFIFIGYIANLQVEATKCRALVLGGGGSLGSYEIGAVSGIVNATLALSAQNFLTNVAVAQPEDIQWDVISGVSAGSINSALLILNKKGDEYWNGVLIDGLFKPGLLDTDPLYNTLKAILDQYKGKPIYRKANIATVKLNTGEYTRFTENNYIKSVDQLIEAVLCSSAIPFAFPPRVCNGSLYIDGGSYWDFDIIGALDRCKEITDDESEIIIDIILCGPASYTPKSTDNIKEWKTLHMLFAKEFYTSAFNTLKQEVQKTHPLVNFRYYVAPAYDIELIPLNFDPQVDTNNIQMGYEDGINAVLNFYSGKR